MRCKVASWRETVMWGLVYTNAAGSWVACLVWLRVRSDLPHDTLRGSWGTRSGCGQEMAGSGVGALVEALGIFLNLLEGFAVRREMGVGLVEQEKVIVPFA